VAASAQELQTIRTKADALRVRNNQIERLVSSLHPDPDNDTNSVLIRGIKPSVQNWEAAMTLLAEQFHSIQELIGMTK
jgi:hypothetical protein